MACGAAGDIRDATADDQAVIDAVKSDVEAKTGKTYAKYTAVKARSQVVAGTNFYVSVDVGDEHIHVRVFKALSGSHKLSGVLEGKSAADSVEYFESN
eukprot:CAMPEP_0201515954 /NCGR_PEP_ID=MMETSP0161_2-20130828/7391_1 /ASSEMBLY_ACC=CAM_ASM_000251 /TAXON_ID=180227 /ORGANISM="Neoparamoeba aestuarina, Strain SoJaBio B1-5/56/2" /LENGTH=97 /DNA_ID=CAMNT_0047912917 /DNA_START=61 /DNA_END=354 /DNA_ORIENTATION=-